jgi:hypothetical protein
MNGKLSSVFCMFLAAAYIKKGMDDISFIVHLFLSLYTPCVSDFYYIISDFPH